MNAPTALIGIDVMITVVFLTLSVAGIRNRHRPGAISAGLLWVGLAIIAGILTLGHADIIPVQTIVYAVGTGWFVIVPLWAAFVFEYTGRGPSVTRRWIAVATVYVIVAVAVTRWGSDLGETIGPVLRVMASLLQTVLIGAGLFAVFLVVRSAVTYDDIPKTQAIALSLGGIGATLLLFSISTVTLNTETLPPAITGFLGVVALGFATGVFRYQLFSNTPGMGILARRSVLEEISEAVIVVDREHRLVDANEAAEQALGVTLSQDAGRPVETTLGYDPETLVNETSTVSTPNGRRQFDISQSVLASSRGDTVGTSYLFQDVTDERTRKQRLEVLNRVLRHNLRNDLDAIRAFAEALSDGSAEESDDVLERIRTTATDLADIGETVERADRIMTQDTLESLEVDLAALVEDVRTSVSERYDCQVTTSTSSDTQSLHTDRAVLRTALLEVVENAVEHSDREEPNVSITVAWSGDAAQIAVRDDGPGIPDREQAILLEGEETPLQHGTGVGLWFVSWAITRLGGQLSLDDLDDSGSEVTLTIPDRRETSNQTAS